MSLISKVLIIIVIYTALLFATDVNGRVSPIGIINNKFVVDLQLNTNTGTDDMGGATIVIGYNNTVLSMATLDYTFHNFSGGNYSVATVTKPTVNQLWINIYLFNNNNGIVVAQAPQWTDMVTLRFSIVNPIGSATVLWLTNSIFWGIYDGNNTTLWDTGSFNGLEYPLPVELSAFTAQQLNNDIQLNWTTETEVGNFGFDVERRIDMNQWTQLDFVLGSGTTNSQKHYKYIDENVTGGRLFEYRLKQIDTDGDYQHSYIVSVQLNPLRYQLYQNYPNPFNSITHIQYELSASGLVTMKLYDINGVEVETLIDEWKSIGVYARELNVSNLSSGVYFYQIQVNNFSQTRKMVVIK